MHRKSSPSWKASRLPFLEENGFELVDVEYVKEGSNWFLRIYVDKEGGIDIDDCGRVSEFVSAKLDELDPIAEAYFLEVSFAWRGAAAEESGGRRESRRQARIRNDI